MANTLSKSDANTEKRNLSTKEIEDLAINYVMNFLKSKGEKPERQKHGADIISKGKYIDVKGCLKRETNIRMTEQALKSIRDAGKLKQGSFFIYNVYDMLSEPKLRIFDYNIFEANKLPETRWLIQPNKIKEKIEPIQLKKIS